MKNGDKLRQMTNEELAYLLDNFDDEFCGRFAKIHCTEYESCGECILSWLDKEVQE